MSPTNGIANGGSKGLPSSKSPNLALVPATEAEKILVWTKNADEWRGALSAEAYLGREKCLSSQDLTKDGGLSTWILIDSTDPTRTILSSCETYRKKALLAINGVVSSTLTHGIGSVFCPPECRGRGYGSRMMVEIGKILKTWQAPEGQSVPFSILYSDIGKTYYSKFGWEAFRSQHISIPARASALSLPTNFPEARPLYASDLPKLCAVDEQLIRLSLQDASKNNTLVALVPDIQTIRWHHAREEYVAQRLQGRVPEVRGAIVGTEPGKRIWCYFTRVFYNPEPTESEDNTLHILRIVVEEHGLFAWEQAGEAEMRPYVPALTALFKIAVEEAEKWTVKDVEIWNPTPATVSAVKMLKPDARVVDRKESISSLMWYGSRRTSGSVADEIHWLGDEKYGWN